MRAICYLASSSRSQENREISMCPAITSLTVGIVLQTRMVSTSSLDKQQLRSTPNRAASNQMSALNNSFSALVANGKRKLLLPWQHTQTTHRIGNVIDSAVGQSANHAQYSQTSFGRLVLMAEHRLVNSVTTTPGWTTGSLLLDRTAESKTTSSTFTSVSPMIRNAYGVHLTLIQP